MKEQFFHPFECVVADGVTVCHGYNLSQFVALWLFFPHRRNYVPLEHHEIFVITQMSLLSCHSIAAT
jgi:hypothetical protein